jgi:hypothetical protein
MTSAADAFLPVVKPSGPGPLGQASAWVGSHAAIGHLSAWVSWLVPTLMMGLSVLAVVSLYVWSFRHPDLGDEGDDGGSDGGGRGRGNGGRPIPPGPRPDAEPDWWPEFERSFAAYVETRLTRAA